MRRIPSLHALKAFESAARLESFLLASAELHLTPSAISHQVRGLEKYFGRQMFVRHNRQVQLTAEGSRLMSQLTNAFDAIEAACADLGPAPQTQELALHCAPSFASKWLGPRLPSFVQQYPAINLRLSASADPIDLKRQDDIDLAIAYGKAPSGRGIVAESLGAEQIMALATPALAARLDPANPTSMAQFVLIQSSVSPVRWSDWFELNDLPIRPEARGRRSIAARWQSLRQRRGSVSHWRASALRKRNWRKAIWSKSAASAFAACSGRCTSCATARPSAIFPRSLHSVAGC